MIFVSCGGSELKSFNEIDRPISLNQLNVLHESCQVISAEDKKSPSGLGDDFSFYTMAEDTKRFSVPEDQSVYVIGDIHGSWEMIFYSLVNSGIMEVDAPTKKTVSIIYKGLPLDVEIPNLKFRDGHQNSKLIFMGDYIAKNDPSHEQLTLAFLNDVLMKQKKQKKMGGHSIVALIGNHDYEAVNGITHVGYWNEKNYRDQVMEMIQKNLLTPTHYDHGIWYSHSYLTPDDIKNFSENGFDFPEKGSSVSDGVLKVSEGVNAFILKLILEQKIEGTWLDSPSENPWQKKPFNFFYVMSSYAADGKTAAANYENFPIIVGHLSDPSRKVLRVLTEAYGGLNRFKFPRRSHILCTDTSIYKSFQEHSPATYLKIDYKVKDKVQFYSCTVPTP